MNIQNQLNKMLGKKNIVQCIKCGNIETLKYYHNKKENKIQLHCTKCGNKWNQEWKNEYE